MKRRSFVSKLLVGVSTTYIGLDKTLPSLGTYCSIQKELELGIIGLSPHSAAFSTILNDKNKGSDLNGCRIKVLYHPKGNPDVEFTNEQLESYKSDVLSAGVEIVNDMDTLLSRVDGVLIETNDGRPHMEQVMPVLEAGKPVFVDKPVAENLASVIEIYETAEKYGVPIFSSSSLRYGSKVQIINQNEKEKVLGASTFSPAPLEPSHTDLFWYGIHGVEMLYSVMGTGCQWVQQLNEDEGEDVVVGYWNGGRIGTFRGIRSGKRGYGGRVFAVDSIEALGTFEGYRPLVVSIVDFFNTNTAPVAKEETLEIYAFMEAAHRSKRLNGERVSLSLVMKDIRENTSK
ncbi:Gfo/Idh/MocA family protein [Membranihabitans maritimus]|uniref:Gfo/Idh/MocA family protein n=1 Tax=Membranihabitans maritimus TaxID=2904244 RepID=UPI001EFFA6A6|nr:Gfo/Idh/MocA family oxidoreductase [Membranihabitans maritimus]